MTYLLIDAQEKHNRVGSLQPWNNYNIIILEAYEHLIVSLCPFQHAAAFTSHRLQPIAYPLSSSLRFPIS